MSDSIGRRHFLNLAAKEMALISLFAMGCSRTKSNKPPNIVLLFADDLGYGDLQCYGHPIIRTPHLDGMADEGIRLTSFYVGAPVCGPSRAALMTGRYPIHAGFSHNIGPASTNGLPLDQLIIAEVLKKAGYHTMAIGKWHLGHGSKALMPTSRGFDHYYGLLYSNDMIKPWVQTDVPIRLYRDLEAIEEPVDQRRLTVNYTRNALDFIHQNADHPFFLYLPYSMPHLPVRTTETFRGKSQAGLYGDVIQTIDWSVGQILTTLRQLELEENTLVIFTSDNGPWLNLPDRMLQKGNERWHSGTPGLLRGAKGTTYEGGMRVPAIVRWPGQIPAATVSGELITSIDIFPTLAAVADAKIPEDYDLDGFNMLPFLKGEKQSPRQNFYYFFTGICEGVRQGAWKYRYSPVNQFRKKRPQGPVKELFHLERDPSERFNVADRYPEKVKDLDFKMRAMAERNGATVHPK